MKQSIMKYTRANVTLVSDLYNFLYPVVQFKNVTNQLLCGMASLNTPLSSTIIAALSSFPLNAYIDEP